MVEKIKVHVGSDNIFADLGLPNPGEHLAKAELASRIAQVLRQRRLTQAPE
jgi:helix-turn-helix protein